MIIFNPKGNLRRKASSLSPSSPSSPLSPCSLCLPLPRFYTIQDLSLNARPDGLCLPGLISPRKFVPFYTHFSPVVYTAEALPSWKKQALSQTVLRPLNPGSLTNTHESKTYLCFGSSWGVKRPPCPPQQLPQVSSQSGGFHLGIWCHSSSVRWSHREEPHVDPGNFDKDG